MVFFFMLSTANVLFPLQAREKGQVRKTTLPDCFCVENSGSISPLTSIIIEEGRRNLKGRYLKTSADKNQTVCMVKYY